MELLSRILSWVFLPLLMPVYALGIALYAPAYDLSLVQSNTLFFFNEDAKNLLVYLFAAFSFLFPALAIMFLRLQGVIGDLMMNSRKERLLPALFVNASAVALYFLLEMKDPKGNIPFSVYALLTGSFLTVFFCTLITFWWKISLHAAGMGIFTGFVLMYFGQMDVFPFWIVPALFIVSGLVMSCRIYLKCHTQAQVFCGFALGGFATAGSMLFYSLA